MPETIAVICSACNARMKAPATAAGRRGTCANCQATFRIPAPPPPAEVETAAAAALDDGTGPLPDWRSDELPAPEAQPARPTPESAVVTCGARAQVPSNLPTDSEPPPRGARQSHPGPSIRCPACGRDGAVEPSAGRVKLVCPDCSEAFHVRFFDGQPAVVFDRPNPAPGPSRRTTAGPPPRKTMGVLALVVAAGCFFSAVAASNAADEYERRESIAADASNQLSINLALATGDYRQQSMREGRKADRTKVYLSVICGVVFTASGLVCLATPNGGPGRRRAPI